MDSSSDEQILVGTSWVPGSLLGLIVPAREPSGKRRVGDVTRPRTIKGYKEHVSMSPYDLHLTATQVNLKLPEFLSPPSASQRLVEMLVKSSCVLQTGGESPRTEPIPRPVRPTSF